MAPKYQNTESGTILATEQEMPAPWKLLGEKKEVTGNGDSSEEGRGDVTDEKPVRK